MEQDDAEWICKELEGVGEWERKNLEFEERKSKRTARERKERRELLAERIEKLREVNEDEDVRHRLYLWEQHLWALGQYVDMDRDLKWMHLEYPLFD